MNFIQSVKTCLRKYANFKGRATRTEFWWFQLFFLLLMIGSVLLLMFLGYGISNDKFDLAFVVEIFLFVPVLSVTARRLHDIGLSGWWQTPVVLIYLEDLGLFIPNFRTLSVVVNITNAAMSFWFVILLICIWRGNIWTNKYGPDPKSPDLNEVFS